MFVCYTKSRVPELMPDINGSPLSWIPGLPSPNQYWDRSEREVKVQDGAVPISMVHVLRNMFATH